jgi:hypothetical protein
MSKRLALFIHGLRGATEPTWQLFPGMIKADADLAGKYDVAGFDYSTGLFGSYPALSTVAQSLKTEIETRYATYSEIAIIAHSQGGLIARQYIANAINSGERLTVRRLLTFATPHLGSIVASLGKWVPGVSQQAKALALDSDFILSLSTAWAQAKGDTRVRTKYVIAADDAVVGPTSAAGPMWSPTLDALTGKGHRSAVKPNQPIDTAFLLTKRFLLEELALPGATDVDHRQPLLHYKHVEPSPMTRFAFGAQYLPFQGRTAELTSLAAFLEQPDQDFHWLVVHGPGGVGKSRLVLEFCHAIRDEWHAGFLHDESQEPDWARWDPIAPTLIAIDYAARNTERVGRLMRGLAGRGPADGTRALAAPVRVLLIERSNDEQWLDDIVGAGMIGKRVQASRAAQDLPVPGLDDPWPIFQHVFREAGRPLPDRAPTLQALAKIDPARRPLFAHFVADAMAAGRDVHQFDQTQLLDDVIRRTRNKFWRPAGVRGPEERALILATMTGGLTTHQLATLADPLLPRWDVDRHPPLFQQMTGHLAIERIAPLEPDIVGEHFVLASLAAKNLTDRDRLRFITHAWQLNPKEMAFFVLRAHSDLQKNAILPLLRHRPNAQDIDPRFWMQTAMHLIAEAVSGFVRISPAESLALLRDMHEVAIEKDERHLWVYWAKSISDFIIAMKLSSAEGEWLIRLMDSLCAVAFRVDDDFIWERWASVAASLLRDIFQLSPYAAGALASNLRIIATLRGEAELWECWALAARNLMALDRASANALLNEIETAATPRNEEGLWACWAYAARFLAIELLDENATHAVEIAQGIRRRAIRRGEPCLWTAWAAIRCEHARQQCDRASDTALTLLDEVRAEARACNEPAIWWWWALTVGGLSQELGKTPHEAALLLLDQLHAAAIDRDDPDIWIMWSKAAANFIRNRHAREPENARRVYFQFIAAMKEAKNAVTAIFFVHWVIAFSVFVSAASGGHEISADNPVSLDVAMMALTPPVIHYAALVNIWVTTGQAERADQEVKKWQETVPEMAQTVMELTELGMAAIASFEQAIKKACSDIPDLARRRTASILAFREALYAGSTTPDPITRVLDRYHTHSLRRPPANPDDP